MCKMQNELYFLIITLLTVIKNVYCERGLSKTNYTMSFFESLEIKDCKSDKDCPEYSNGCYFLNVSNEKIGICNVYMFCHKKGNCLKLSLGEFEKEYEYRWPYYKTESYDILELFMNSCNSKYLSSEVNDENIKPLFIDNDNTVEEYLYTDTNNKDDYGIYESCYNQIIRGETCENNSNCFSNICNENKICEVDTNNQAYVCTLAFNENGNHSIRCLLMNQEICEKNNECLSNICDSNYRICVSKDSKKTFFEKASTFFNNNIKILTITFFGIFFYNMYNI